MKCIHECFDYNVDVSMMCKWGLKTLCLAGLLHSCVILVMRRVSVVLSRLSVMAKCAACLFKPGMRWRAFPCKMSTCLVQIGRTVLPTVVLLSCRSHDS